MEAGKTAAACAILYGNLAQANHFANYITLALASFANLYAGGRIHGVAVAAGAATYAVVAVLNRAISGHEAYRLKQAIGRDLREWSPDLIVIQVYGEESDTDDMSGVEDEKRRLEDYWTNTLGPAIAFIFSIFLIIYLILSAYLLYNHCIYLQYQIKTRMFFV